MHNVETVTRYLIKVSEVTLSGGWRGLAAVSIGVKELFTKADWEKLLDEPEKLLEGTQQTLKSDGANTVTVKYLDIGGRGVKAVIKLRQRSGVRGFFRSMGRSHAIRNFNAAVSIKELGLPVASPLAAVYHRNLIFCDQSIYISEYVEGTNLFEYLRSMREEGEERYRMMREVCGKMAEIFAKLRRYSIWHRDAKATNFVVNKDESGDRSITITDVDGIKCYFTQSEDRLMRGLWQLASSVMGLAGITRTDYLRTFEMYCDYVGIAKERRRDIYRGLAEKAQAKFRQRQARRER